MPKKKKVKRKPKKKRALSIASDRPRCGLCGKIEHLTKTECCDQWICDDEDQYRLFSFARNSCSRNHRRYTLCGYHFAEGHAGDWKECAQCRDAFETEMYVSHGANEYNFEKLENPPEYEPTQCGQCGKVIALGHDGYSLGPEGYLCEQCTVKKFPDLPR